MTQQTQATQPVQSLGEVRVVPLSSVRPYGRNPRKIPGKAIEQTAKSIREFGWQQPIVVDAELVIIAGHTRRAAAEKLGLAEVPVVVAEHLTPEQVRAYRIVDNRDHDYSTWDYTAVVEELNGLGETFADVLDLADWGKLLEAFEDSAGPGGHTRQDLPPLPEGQVLPGTGYSLTVEFATREDADRAGPALLDIAGVINVRHNVGYLKR